jgi:ABC-type amino acid transport substrate-binding protein
MRLPLDLHFLPGSYILPSIRIWGGVLIRKHLLVIIIIISGFPSLWAETPLQIACAEGSASEAFIPLVRAVYADLGVIMEIHFMPPERAIQAANMGHYCGDVGRADIKIEMYPNLMKTDEPLGSIRLVPWVMPESALTIQSPEDLNGRTVAYVRGLKMAETFCHAAGIDAVAVNSFDALIKMLQAGRVDVVLSACPSTCETLKQVAIPLPVTLVQYDSFHLLNREYAALGNRFDDALRTMKANGRYEIYYRP